jgi:glycosyltransferase involved in cell wall biosynthesis
MTRPMKLGIIVPGFSASEDDWCIPALLDLVKGLAGCPNLDVHVFPLRYPHENRPYDVFGATVHPLGGAYARGASRLPLLARAVRAVRREHSRVRFDLLHAYWADEPGFVAALGATILRVPAIVSLAGGELARLPDISYGGQLNSANRLMTSLALRTSAHLTAGSRFLIELARPRTNSKPMTRLPLGVDLTRFSPGVSSAGEAGGELSAERVPQILSVASLVPVKDQISLLQAFAKTVEVVPGACLHLVGDGPMREALQQQAALLGVDQNVLFHGDVAHERMPDLYRRADFCVLSSRFEAQGMVVLEAAGCGKPTVGTRVGVIPEFNADLSVEVGDVDVLAGEMIALARNPRLREQRACDATSIARREFALESTIERQLDLYRFVLGQG